jgi:hypothetical protein
MNNMSPWHKPVEQRGVASIPSTRDILLPPRLNLGNDEQVMQEREWFEKYGGKPIPDADLLALLSGQPLSHENMTLETNGGMSNGGNNQPPLGPVADSAPMPTPDNQDRPAMTSTSHTAQQSQRPGGGFMNASMNSQFGQLRDELLDGGEDSEAYRQLVKRQLDAYSGKLAGQSEFDYLDLSAPMALVDQLTGSNMARSYKGPASAQSDMGTMNTLGKQLADHEEAKVKSRTALLNAIREREGKANPFELEKLKQGHRLQLAGMKSAGKNGGLTKAQEVVDREFAKEYNKYVVSGGYGDAMKGLDQLRSVSAKLAESTKLTGPLRGKTPDWALPLVNPEAASVKDTIEDVVQRNLREVLGAQFTEKEGERLIARAFNKNLSEAENKIRVDRLIKQVEAVARAKIAAARHYEQHGTLGNYKPITFNSIDDFDNFDADSYIGSNSATPTQPSGKPASTAKPAAKSKPKTVTQNGHTYTLNEQTGEYE